MEVKMEFNSLRWLRRPIGSWELKWTIVNETASIQSYRPARSALLPASAGFTPYLTPFYPSRNLNNIIIFSNGKRIGFPHETQ